MDIKVLIGVYWIIKTNLKTLLVGVIVNINFSLIFNKVLDSQFTIVTKIALLYNFIFITWKMPCQCFISFLLCWMPTSLL